ncbi:MAG: hypothetical protein Q4F97_08770 [Bacteroidales bacterium]|nr:hypothetical protein [Bacteroidales bacterium]
MKKIILLLMSALLLLPQNGFTQKSENVFGIGLSGSTNGVGGGLYWQPTSRWKLSLNGEYMPKINVNTEIEESKVTVDLDAKYKTGGVFLTGGYQFLRFMYVVGGVGVNFFNANGIGTPHSIEYGDITLEPSTVGTLTLDVKSGAKIAPYIGIGFGKQAPKRRVSLSAEIGTYYMGAPKLDIVATGMLEPTQEATHIQQLQDEFSQFKFYPVLKLSLTIKLFKL